MKRWNVIPFGGIAARISSIVGNGTPGVAVVVSWREVSSLGPVTGEPVPF